MTAQQLLDLLDAAGLSTRQYSGRGTYGKYCPAFTVDGDAALMVSALNITREADHSGVTDDQLHEAFRNVITDSMGRSSTIVYFPRYTFEAVTK